MLTPQQIKWAGQHDWFVADMGNGTIQICDRWSQLHKDGTVTHHEQVRVWDGSFRSLRNWAGY
jgi:hypothetical protein